jgi:transcription termination factor NusA
LPGIGEATQEKLATAGIDSIETLATKTEEELTAIEGMGPKTAAKLIESAQEWISQRLDFSSMIKDEIRVSPTTGAELFRDIEGEDEEEKDEDEEESEEDGAGKK